MGRKSKGFKIATARSKRAQAGQLEAEALAIRSDPAHTLSRLSSSVSRFAKAQVGDASGNYGPEFLVTDHNRQAVSAAMTAAHGPARVTGGTELPLEIPPTATAGYFSASRSALVGGTQGPEYLMPIADGIRRMNEIPVADRTIKGVPADILKMERLQELIGQAPAHERAGLERRFNATARAGIDLDDSGRIPFPPGSPEYEATEKILRVLAPLDREARLRVISGARTKHTAIQQEINTYPAELRTGASRRSTITMLYAWRIASAGRHRCHPNSAARSMPTAQLPASDSISVAAIGDISRRTGHGFGGCCAATRRSGLSTRSIGYELDCRRKIRRGSHSRLRAVSRQWPVFPPL